MEFEDMKKIWDEQNNENIYTINESELHRRVIRNKNRVKRMIDKFEWTFLLVMFGVGLFATIKGILDNQLFHFLDAFIFFLAAGYFYKSRLDRIKYEGQSNLSLLGDLEQAMRSLDYHGKRHKNFIIWCILPMVCITLIQLVYTYNNKPWWLWIIAFGSFVFADWSIKKELHCKILPKKEDLLHLRSLLLKDD
jgi:hypothetical protein